jgi:hypothetical protein
MTRFQVPALVAVMLALVVLVLAVAPSHVAAQDSPSGALATGTKVMCVCRCCLHNDCRYLANASWVLDDCSSCDAARCRKLIVSGSTRQRIARAFDILVNLEQIVEADSADRRVMMQHTLESLSENRWDVCEVTAMVETVTCVASGTPSACQATADLSAVCFDRNGVWVKYGVFAFLTAVIGGCVFAFVKNYLLGCLEFNIANFDY